jgi:hypothetical protein
VVWRLAGVIMTPLGEQTILLFLLTLAPSVNLSRRGGEGLSLRAGCGTGDAQAASWFSEVGERGRQGSPAGWLETLRMPQRLLPGGGAPSRGPHDGERGRLSSRRRSHGTGAEGLGAPRTENAA